MGLAICKKIVNDHGGDITVKSAPGKGTTFVISLPENQSVSAKKILGANDKNGR